MPNTTTVTHPDGTRSTRTSKSRIYTHAVQVSPADPYILAQHLKASAVGMATRAELLRRAADNGKVIIRDRRMGGDRDLYTHEARLSGTDGQIYTWCSAEGQTETHPERHPAPPVVREVDAYLRAQALESAKHWETQAAKTRQEADTILAAGTLVGAWSVERWSSRRDLAQKAADGEFAYLRERGHQVRVIPVDGAPLEEGLGCSYGHNGVKLTAGGTCVDCENRVAPTMADPMLYAELDPSEYAPDPADDCTDTCCVEAAAQDVEEAGGMEQAIRLDTEAPRVKVGDVVTIHRGKDPRLVLNVDTMDTDQVQVCGLDPNGPDCAWWVSMDLVHQVPPVPVSWGQVLQMPDGRRYFITSENGDTPILQPTR